MPSLQLLAIYPQVKRRGGGGGVASAAEERMWFTTQERGVSVSREKGENNKETEK